MTNYYAPLRYVSGTDTYTVIDPREGAPSSGGGSYVSILDHGGSGNDLDDNTAAMNAALAALDATGGTLFFPPGIYRFATTPNAVPGGVTLLGTGIGWNAPWDAGAGGAPHRASVLKASAAMTDLIVLGSNSASSAPAGGAGASIRSLSVYGAGLTQSAVRTAGRRNYIIDSEVAGGTQQAVFLDGQNSHVIGGVVGNLKVGHGIRVAAIDSKVYDCQVREAGLNKALIQVESPNAMIERNHLYHTSGGLAAVNVDSWGRSVWGVQIVGNTIEECSAPEIRIRASDTAGSADRPSGILIVGNHGYTRTANVPFVDTVGVGPILDVTMVGNHARGETTASPYSSLVRFPASSGADRWIITGNVGSAVTQLFEGTVPSGVRHFGNVISSTPVGPTTQRSDNNGVATFAGTGSQQAFTIAHGLGATPRTISVTPGSEAAASAYYASSDGTNITVTFTAAPANAASVVLNWQASR